MAACKLRAAQHAPNQCAWVAGERWAPPLLHMRLKAFAGPFGVCYQVVTRTTWQLVAVSDSLTTKEHQLPNSCCCRRAFTRDHPLSGFPAGQPPYLHGPVPDLPAPTAVPVQEVMVPFAFNSNLLIGSAPRTLPIRFSMTTTMLLFVIASLLASPGWR